MIGMILKMILKTIWHDVYVVFSTIEHPLFLVFDYDMLRFALMNVVILKQKVNAIKFFWLKCKMIKLA